MEDKDKKQLLGHIVYPHDEDSNCGSKNAPVAEQSVQLATPVFVKNDLVESFWKRVLEGNSQGAAEIMSALLERESVSVEFVLRAGITLLDGDPSYLYQFLKGMMVSRTLDHDEIRLFCTLLLLNQGRFEDAHEEVKVSTKKRILHERDLGSFESRMIVGYRTLLLFYLKKQKGFSNGTAYATFLNLYENNVMFLPFSEAFGEALFQAEGPESLINFIEDWSSRVESKEYGVMPYLQCLNLITSFIPSSRRLKFHILEQVAENDPSNIHVLALCRILLRNEVPNMDSETEESSNEFDEDSGNEETYHTSVSREKNIIRCFRIVLEFLDFACNHESSEGWSILAEALFSLCLLGTRECAKEVVNSWHSDRKSWWPQIHFEKIAVKIEDTEITKFLNKGIACFVLESEEHSFVKLLTEKFEKKAVYLTSSINQLREKKKMLDRLTGTSNKLNENFAVGVLTEEREESQITATVTSHRQEEGGEIFQLLPCLDDNGCSSSETEETRDSGKQSFEENCEVTANSDDVEGVADLSNDEIIDIMKLASTILERRKERVFRKAKRRKL